MLATVEVRNTQGSLLSLPLEDPSAGYVVADIEGLEPVKATLVSSGFANMDGEQYHSSRREKRNVVLRLSVEPDYVTESVRDLRNRLYEFFMPKTEVELRFIMNDGLSVKIMGRIETFDFPLFARDPEATISLLCFDPDFVDVNARVFTGMTTDTSTETPIPYDGTIEAGITFSLFVDRSLSLFHIHHRGPDGDVRSMTVAASLLAGDVVTINTRTGQKIATLTRAGITTSLVYAVSPASEWTELGHGDNLIRVQATGAAIPFQIDYADRYGGL